MSRIPPQMEMQEPLLDSGGEGDGDEEADGQEPETPVNPHQMSRNGLGFPRGGYHSDVGAAGVEDTGDAAAAAATDYDEEAPRYQFAADGVMRAMAPTLGRARHKRVYKKIADKRGKRQSRATRKAWPRDGWGLQETRGRVSAYCTCDELRTDSLIQTLAHEMQGQWANGDAERWSHEMYADTVRSFTPTKDVFFTPYGCVVCWGVPEEDEGKILDMIKPHQDDDTSELASDDMAFTHGEASRVKKDVVTLSSTDPVEKLAVSFALAQSVKLSIFENRIAQTIAETRHIPVHLSESGSIGLSQLDISKQIGALFIERNLVNLHSDMLDTPDFFWDSDDWEHVYDLVSKYLDVENRVEIVNRRIDIIRELLDMLNDQLNNQHASKLEWIVIWLIVVEVVVEVVWNITIKDLLGWVDSCNCG